MTGFSQTFPQTWVVVADGSRARVFEWTNRTGPLAEVNVLVNPEGRLKEGELTSDRPGSSFSSKGYQSGHPTRSRHSAVETVADEFAKAVVGELKEGLNARKFERLVLVASPRFLGQLRSHFNRNLEQSVVASLDLDLTRESAEAIFQRLPELTGADRPSR